MPGIGFDRQPHPEGDDDRHDVADQRVERRRFAQSCRAAAGRAQPTATTRRSPARRRTGTACGSGSSRLRDPRQSRSCFTATTGRSAGSKLPVAPHALEVGERPARCDQRREPLVGKLAIFAVRDRADDQVVALAVRARSASRPYSRSTSSGSASGSATVDLVAEPLQPPRPGRRVRLLRRSGTFSLKVRPSTSAVPALLAPVVQRVGDPGAHPVVGLAAGQDHLRIVAELLRADG